MESDRLAQFHWLVVEETLSVRAPAEARVAPWMFDIMRDFGAIEPHLGRFPEVVEAALLHLLLAPWEDWSTLTDLDWRGFRVPWIYSLDDDLFVHPKRPPSADDLSLEPWIITDTYGEEIELERVTARIAAAPCDASAAKQYLELFELRSAFVHGRGGMQTIPSAQRVTARSRAQVRAGFWRRRVRSVVRQSR